MSNYFEFKSLKTLKRNNVFFLSIRVSLNASMLVALTQNNRVREENNITCSFRYRKNEETKYYDGFFLRLVKCIFRINHLMVNIINLNNIRS